MSLAYQLAEDHPGTLVDMRRIDLPKSFPGHGLIRDDDIHDLERGGEQLAVVHLGTEVGLPLKERLARGHDRKHVAALYRPVGIGGHDMAAPPDGVDEGRSEEHTSELQSRGHLVCRLLLEKKKKTHTNPTHTKKNKQNTHQTKP